MIDRIDAEDTDKFHQQYVADRKPCIITSLPEDLSCLAQCTDLAFLRRHAGEAPIAVEPISNKGTYGTAATKRNMSMSEFLDLLQSDEKVYLTTQYSEEEDFAVLNEPLSTLHHELKFPIMPELAGHLVPAKINIWLGASAMGTTSGLHHDFHDNFYILLSGQKRFRIFKPTYQACKKLKINGRPHEIFKNGLISHNGSMSSDGLTASTKAQVRVDLCERALENARASNENIEATEEQYEEAVDLLLQSKLQDDEESEDGEFEDAGEFEEEEGDYEDGIEDDPNGDIDSDTDAEFDGVQDLPEFHTAGRQEISESTSQTPPRSTEKEQNADEPPSFSGLSTEEVAEMLEDNSLESTEFVLQKGELLYLPASYFHEVISMSGTQNYHMAVNYWFFPPDKQDGTYQDEDVMQELRNRLKANHPVKSKVDDESKKRKLEA